jgi:hypothetical protein
MRVNGYTDEVNNVLVACAHSFNLNMGWRDEKRMNPALRESERRCPALRASLVEFPGRRHREPASRCENGDPG